MRERDPFSGQRMFDVKPELLRKVSVFTNLSDEELDRVSRMCDGLLYMPGQCVVARSDNSKSVYFILEGRVKIVNYASGEREVLFREMSTGQMFGELAAISGEPRSAEVWTVEETRVARISASEFWHLMSTNSTALKAILQHIVGLMYSLSERVFEHDSLKVGSRIHAELLRLARAHGIANNRAEISPAHTREDLGKRVGTTRFAVSGELQKLERAQIIEISWRKVVLVDAVALERLVQGGSYGGRYANDESHLMSTLTTSCQRRDHQSVTRAPSSESEFAMNAMRLWDRSLQRWVSSRRVP